MDNGSILIRIKIPHISSARSACYISDHNHYQDFILPSIFRSFSTTSMVVVFHQWANFGEIIV